MSPRNGEQRDVRRASGKTATTWRLPASIELTIASEELAGYGVRSLLLSQATDRPDRLEARVTPSPGAESAPLLAGLPVTLRVDARARFSGVVESVRSGIHADSGSWLTVVAYTKYQSLRSTTTASYYQVTDGELARKLAGELELVPVVDTTHEIHSRVVVRGDPLVVLRAAAARSGNHLAVTGGRLYFVRDLPILEEVRPPDFRREVLACEWRCSRIGERRGTIETLGSGRWRPLAGFHLRGAPGVEDGPYRVDRVVHSLGLDGFRSELEVTKRTCGAGP